MKPRRGTSFTKPSLRKTSRPSRTGVLLTPTASAMRSIRRYSPGTASPEMIISRTYAATSSGSGCRRGPWSGGPPAVVAMSRHPSVVSEEHSTGQKLLDAHLVQDLGGDLASVLADPRGCRGTLGAHDVEPPRCADQCDPVGFRLDDVQPFRLRMFEVTGNPENRRKRDVGLREQPLPFGGRLGQELTLDDRDEGVVVLLALGEGVEAGIVVELGAVDGGDEPAPELHRGGEVDGDLIAARGLEAEVLGLEMTAA